MFYEEHLQGLHVIFGKLERPVHNLLINVFYSLCLKCYAQPETRDKEILFPLFQILQSIYDLQHQQSKN